MIGLCVVTHALMCQWESTVLQWYGIEQQGVKGKQQSKDVTEAEVQY